MFLSMFQPIDFRKAFRESGSTDFDRLLKLAVVWIRRFAISKYRHLLDLEALAIDVLFAMSQRLEDEIVGIDPIHQAKVLSLGRTIAKRRVLREIENLSAVKRQGLFQEVSLRESLSGIHQNECQDDLLVIECDEIIDRLVTLLTIKQRRSLRLRIDGNSESHIASDLGITLRSVERQSEAIRRKLAAKLGNLLGELPADVSRTLDATKNQEPRTKNQAAKNLS